MTKPFHIMEIAYSGDESWMTAVELSDGSEILEMDRLAELLAAATEAAKTVDPGAPIRFVIDVPTVAGYPAAEAEIAIAWFSGAPIHVRSGIQDWVDSLSFR